MIITLIGADFSKSNIGTLSSWIISRVLGDGTTYAGPSYVDKDAALSATVTLDEGYEISSDGITVTMGGIALDESCYSIVDNVITFTIDSVTGNVVIKVPTLNINISNYTFTINPTPIDATVTLSATGYPNVSGTGSQSITVSDGTTVNWNASADGYVEQNGTWIVNGSNKTENITLSASNGEPGTYNLATATWAYNKYTKHTTGTISSGATEGATGHGTYTACLDFIPVTGGTTYSLTLDGEAKIMKYKCWYSDANEESYISGSETKETTFTAPDNAKYLRFTIMSPYFYETAQQVVDADGKLTNPDASRIDLVVVA